MKHICTCVHSGTPLVWTPLGLSHSVLIRGVSLFQGLFNIRKILMWPFPVSALLWMSAFQGCSQGRAPLYVALLWVKYLSTLYIVGQTNLGYLHSIIALQQQWQHLALEKIKHHITINSYEHNYKLLHLGNWKTLLQWVLIIQTAVC